MVIYNAFVSYVFALCRSSLLSLSSFTRSGSGDGMSPHVVRYDGRCQSVSAVMAGDVVYARSMVEKP